MDLNDTSKRIANAGFPSGREYRITVEDWTIGPDKSFCLRIEDQKVKAEIMADAEGARRLRDWLTAWLERHGE